MSGGLCQVSGERTTVSKPPMPTSPLREDEFRTRVPVDIPLTDRRLLGLGHVDRNVILAIHKDPLDTVDTEGGMHFAVRAARHEKQVRPPQHQVERGADRQPVNPIGAGVSGPLSAVQKILRTQHPLDASLAIRVDGPPQQDRQRGRDQGKGAQPADRLHGSRQCRQEQDRPDPDPMARSAQGTQTRDDQDHGEQHPDEDGRTFGFRLFGAFPAGAKPWVRPPNPRRAAARTHHPRRSLTSLAIAVQCRTTSVWDSASTMTRATGSVPE